MAHALVTGIKDEIAHFAKRPVAPLLQLDVQMLGSAADLGRGQAFDAELAQDGFHLPGGDALHVHLGHRQHHRAHGALTALE